MNKLLTLILVGFAAQLVDGSLGMAYGVTSSTLLLTIGLAPAAVSASVHLAEIGTTLASGTAHWRFGNVDWRVVLRIGLPGAVGGFAGATLLSNLSTASAKPWMSILLLALGIYILARFVRGVPSRKREAPPRTRFLVPLGLIAGAVDATGGGGWGPIATPTLLSTGRMSPRKVIGTVDTSEFLVAVGASAGFLLGLQGRGIVWTAVGALLAGGLVAAPIAAYLIRVVPAQMLGSAVGGIIILTNTRVLLGSASVTGGAAAAVYAVVLAVWGVALTLGVRATLRARRADAERAALPADQETPAQGTSDAEQRSGAPVTV